MKRTCTTAVPLFRHLNGEPAQPSPAFVNHQQCARLQGVGRGSEQPADARLLRRVQFVPETEQYDTGAASLGVGKDFREVKVLGQQHASVQPRPSEQVRVRGRGQAEVAPVAGLPSSLLQNRQSLRAEVHVHEYLQVGTGASSSSSTRTEA